MVIGSIYSIISKLSTLFIEQDKNEKQKDKERLCTITAKEDEEDYGKIILENH